MYDFDFTEEHDIRGHVKSFFLHPEFLNDPTNQIHIPLTWNRIEFNPGNQNLIPRSKGIYAFVLIPQYPHFFETRYLFYVGKTNRTLRQRFGEYLKEMAGKGKVRKKINKMLNQYSHSLYFYFAELSNSADVDLCEECILNTFVPHINSSIPRAKIKNELKNLYELN